MWLVFLLLFTVPAGAWGAPENSPRAADRAFNAASYDAARDLYEQGLRIAVQEGHKATVCELLNDLAAVAMAQGQERDFRQWIGQARACQAQLPVVVQQPDTGSLLVNGGFEQGLVHPWGTGHYEDRAGKTAFGLWWNSLNTKAFMKIDTEVRHSGQRALRVTNYSPIAPHVFTTTSQRITGLRPNTVYRISLWAKAQDLAAGAVSFAVDAAWVKRLLGLPAGTWDWRPFSATINIGYNDTIDLRLIHQNTGTVWLDDIVVAEEAGEPADPGGLLQQAESLRDSARLAEALSLYQTLLRAQPDNVLARHGAGRVKLALGRYPEALEDFQWLADRKFRDAPLALGDLHQQLGELERARDDYQQAMKAVAGDQGTYSLVLDRLAVNALSRGDAGEAQRAQQGSLRILRHIGDEHGQAVALQTLGGISARLGDRAAAESSFREALSLARRLEDQRLTADLLVGLADLQAQGGARKEAMRGVEEALTIQKAVGDARGQIAALQLRARLRRQAGERQAALEDLRAAAGLLTELYTRLGGIPQETRAAFLGQFDALYRDYLDLLLELYQERPRPEWLEEALQTGEKARSRRFTEMMNETRAAAALAGAGDPEFTARLRTERETRLALESVLQRRALLEQTPAGRRNLTLVAELEAEQRRVEAALRNATADLARTYPRYEDLRNPKPLRIADVQALLGPDEALLAYFVTAGHTGIFAFTPQQTRLVVLPVGREKLLAQTAAIREAMPAVAEAIINQVNVGAEGIMAAMKRYDPTAAYQTYRLLVTPVAEIIHSAQQVYLAPDDILYRLPFETLLTRPPNAGPQGPDLAKADYWVRHQALSYLPSVAVLYSLRHLPKSRGQDRRPLVAFADPVFESSASTTREGERGEQWASRGSLLRRLQQRGALRGASLPRLPETAEEARTAMRVLGASEQDLYLRERATEYHVKHQPLARYRYLLFATHGFLAGEFGGRVQPALALSFVGDPQNDGLLEMGEILGLNLDADLVTLSACNTGRGTGDDRGEGFAGLTRSFMYAGAESLAVTLWSVESRSAQRLAEAFYRGLPRGSRAQALAEAKREFISQAYSIELGEQHQISSAHPFFWAPFILVGEGR